MATNDNGQAESSGRLYVIDGPSFNIGYETKKPNPRVTAIVGRNVEVI